jgi:phosphate transport system permease protein
MTRAETPTSTVRRSRVGTLSAARRAQNGLAMGLIGLSALIVLVPLFSILRELLMRGVSSLSPQFFTETQAQITFLGSGGGFLNAMVGSLLMLAVALAIGLLVGIGTGIFLSEYREHPLVPAVRLMGDVLNGMPAIVVGLVVYGALVVTFKAYSGFAGGVALGLIMIPVIVRATEEVLKLVPQTLREAGLALGIPRWKVIMNIVLPTARSGIITGVILAVARVSGEAAPLIFTALGNNILTFNLTQPMSALPLAVYRSAFQPSDAEVARAWAGALVLVTSILIASLTARYFARQR